MIRYRLRNINMTKSLRRGYFIYSSLVLLLFCSCKLPVDPQERDLVELERIWQHLSAYSIYTDRVPNEKKALSFDDPFTLVMSIQDTMHSPWRPTNDTFGIYYYSWEALYIKVFGPERNNDATYFRQLSNNTAYVHINSFSDSTYYEVLALTNSIRNIPNIILDLRNNGGGFVDICKYIVELFLPVNTPYLYEERREAISGGNFTTIQETVKTQYPDTSDWGGKKIALLINKRSASASEILAIALRVGMNSANLTIIGETSFGKGIGQYVFFFNTTSGGGLKLTGLRFKGVSGNDYIDIYHEKGIIPDNPFIGSFKEELIEAGKWLDPDFENTVDTLALNKVVADNITERMPRFIGCYKIAKLHEY